jgi:hypothetical protein
MLARAMAAANIMRKVSSCLVFQKFDLTLESVPDSEEVTLDLSLAELNLTVLPVVKLRLVPVVGLAAVTLEPVVSAEELSGTWLLEATRE